MRTAGTVTCGVSTPGTVATGVVTLGVATDPTRTSGVATDPTVTEGTVVSGTRRAAAAGVATPATATAAVQASVRACMDSPTQPRARSCADPQGRGLALENRAGAHQARSKTPRGVLNSSMTRRTDNRVANFSAVIRLYRAPFSTNVERVALALAHKGLAVQSVVIDYSDRSEVERVSGQGLVPVIEDDGTVVFDSMEIVAYLEERYPAAPLFPAEEARRAEMLIFIDWFNRVWKGPPNEIEAELAKPDADRERVAQLSAEMAVALDRFEAMLTRRDHVMSHEFSAADCAVFPFLKYALFRDPADDELFHRVLDEHQQLGEDHPRLGEWICRVNERPRA